MILLSLGLFLQYDLLQCVEFEKVDLNGLLRAHNQSSSLRNNTPAAYQLDPHTPEFPFFTPPDDFHLSPTFEDVPLQTRRSQNIHDPRHKLRNIFFRHLSRPKKDLRVTLLDTSKKTEERQESQKKASLYKLREQDTSERSSSESEQEGLTDNPVTHTSENSYSRSEEKTSDNSESSSEPEVHKTRRPKTVSPATLRTTEETTRHKWRLIPDLLLPTTLIDENNDAGILRMTPPTSKPELNSDDDDDVSKRNKPHKDKLDRIFGDDKDIFKIMRQRKDKVNQVFRMHVIKKKHKKTFKPASDRESFTDDRNSHNDADILKMTPPRSKHEWNFEDDIDALTRKEPHKNKHGGRFDDDNEIFKMTGQKMTENKNIGRMHVISDTTKRVWYSDREMMVESDEETEHTKTVMPVTTRQSLRQIPNSDWSRYDESDQEQDTTVSTTIKHIYASSSMEYLRAPLSKNYFFKIMEHRQEGYMIVFLIELMQIIGTKEQADAYDIVKHADPIVHRQNKQLLWMGHPFLNVTRKLATMLKVKDITSIQAQAGKVYHQLLHRHDALPVDVNTILEYAETMYDDDEGKVLFDALRELVSFPDIALSGYWLCNSLINAFLRPFRRLKDTQQLKDLMNSINFSLKKHNSLRSNQKQPLRSGRGFRARAYGLAVDNQTSPHKESSNQTEPEIITPRLPGKRKSKHHHRHHKRNRDKKQRLLRQRYTRRHQKLTLTSVTPRTWVLFRVTTSPTYAIQ